MMNPRQSSCLRFSRDVCRRSLAVLMFLLLAALSGGRASGQLLDWAVRVGGTSSDQGQGVAVDGNGNSYVSGSFNGTATFGSGEANETILTSAGSLDIFVAKYDNSGALMWAVRAGGTSGDVGMGIAVDGSGNSYVSGFFVGTATFGLGEANETILTSAGFADIFVAKYDSGGALVWAVRAGGTSGSYLGRAIAVDGSGNSYVTGQFPGTVTFGPGEVNETTLTSAGSNDLFVAKYDSGGALTWAVRAGGTEGFDRGQAIAVDGSGNSYATGVFSGTATFGLGEANETTLTGSGAGSQDIFVAKYDGGGALMWAVRAGGTDVDQGFGIAVDGSGNSYVSGFFARLATFGPGQINQTTLSSAGSTDIFLAKYDSAGALMWAVGAGGTGLDRGQAIAIDGSGNSYVSGIFVGTATFGPGNANETTLTSAGIFDIFVAKYDSAGALVWAVRAGGTSTDQGLAIAVDGSGNSYVSGFFNGTATFGPGETNETSLTSAGNFDVFVAKYGADNDEAGPITSNVVADPNPASVNEAITLSAKIDDSATGESEIASADFEIRDENNAVVHSGAGNNTDCPSPDHLCPVDEFGNPEAAPAFDAVMEDVEVWIPAGTLASGVYDACIRGTDASGNTGDFECAYLVVYDPDGGFVTGGGWIYSESGFCSLDALCASAEGKANFGFVSKYKKGAKVPTGQTQFQFKAGGLNFHSAEYEWLVVSGAMAQYKGSGTINGAGDYGFLLTARDSAINGGPAEDTFRIKIWEKVTETIVYDNGTDQPIEKGSIVIHTK